MHNMRYISVVLFMAPLMALCQSVGVTPAPAFILLVPDHDSITVSDLKPLKMDTPHVATCFSPEGYVLYISRSETTLYAKSAAGFSNGKKTYDQIIAAHTGTKVPALEIVDYPAYSYRGMHLDVCRHFFSKAFIKQYIDILAAYKMNVFHWHLTDDQGWRIEIKKYPRLTEIGAWRTEADGQRYGGFYSQADIQEIVAYAADRYITIIPEIELPGHSSAALAAYPQFGCTGEQLFVPHTWGIKSDIYAPTDSTFTFLEDILSEVCDLFPSHYIHIGGDEAPKGQWKNSKIAQRVMQANHLKNEEELQNYFMHRVENYLHKKGRTAIGWGEIVKGGLSDSMIVMSWMDKTAGIKAAKHSNKVIMAPRGFCYFDYPQKGERPRAIWMLPLPIKKVYSFQPVSKRLNGAQNELILGGEAALWTEYVKTEEQAIHQLMPRMAAIAEALWTPENRKNFKEFSRRIYMRGEK